MKEFHKMRFDSLQALRGAMAVFVVLEHVRFLGFGAFGVDVFFCLSGFVILFSTHKGVKHFLRRRLIRILPLYELMTLGTWLLLLLFPGWFQQSTANPAFLIKSMLFIPFNIGGGMIQPLMRIGWTVNCEIFFYLIFALSMRISHRYRGVICSAVLLAVVAAEQVLRLDSAPMAFYGNPIMLEMVLGMACYYAAGGLYRLREEGRLPRISLLAGTAGAALCLAWLLCSSRLGPLFAWRRLVLWGIPGAVLLLCVFTLGLWIRFPGPLVWLGDISFSLYLMHYYPVIFLDRALFDFSACTFRSVCGVALALLVSVGLAAVSHEVIEKRLTGWLRQKLARE